MLKETWDRLKTELRQKDKERELRRVCAGQTDIVTLWAPDGAKKKVFYSFYTVAAAVVRLSGWG